MFRQVTRSFFAGLVMTLLAASLSAQAPVINAVLNGADFSTRLCPGVFATIFGGNIGPAQGQVGAAPGLVVTVGGQNATIAFSQANQVNIVIPAGVALGAANVVLTFQGRASASFAINLEAAAPAMLTLNFSPNGGAPACFRRPFSPIASTNVPLAGETLDCAVTGLGQAGAPAVSVGGVPATGISIGPAPFPNAPGGINVSVVPGALAPGDYYGQLRIDAPMTMAVR
jgi:uncharacterized protein (TIGR03437 family)